MLKRQRPATPPPSSLDDPPSFLPDAPRRPSYTTDPYQPRSKRQRTQPPPLDSALRGWLESGQVHGESDGEEDWIEDAHDVLPPAAIPDQYYKGANNLLHELHILNQHRLLFVQPPRDRPENAVPHTYDPLRQAAQIDAVPYQPVHDKRVSSRFIGGKGFVEEVQCVRQRYEDTNRLLGSLFLSRRQEVKEMASSDPDLDR